MQMTAYELRISDLSSDVCSSDLLRVPPAPRRAVDLPLGRLPHLRSRRPGHRRAAPAVGAQAPRPPPGRVRGDGRARARGGAGMTAASDPVAARPLPPDEAARERIRTDLDTTPFAEAGAG